MQLVARHMVNIKWQANDNGDGRKMSANKDEK